MSISIHPSHFCVGPVSVYPGITPPLFKPNSQHVPILACSADEHQFASLAFLRKAGVCLPRDTTSIVQAKFSTPRLPGNNISKERTNAFITGCTPLLTVVDFTD